MGFSAGMSQQCSIRIKPLSAFYTIVSTEVRELFRCLGILKPAEVLSRGKVGLYLIEIPMKAVKPLFILFGTVHLPCLSSRLCDSPLARDPHFVLVQHVKSTRLTAQTSARW